MQKSYKSAVVYSRTELNRLGCSLPSLDTVILWLARVVRQPLRLYDHR